MFPVSGCPDYLDWQCAGVRSHPMDSTEIDLSVVVPTFQSAEILREFASELSTVLSSAGINYEIIIVNDASPDATWSEINRLAQENDNIIGIDLLHNHGQSAATMCGLTAASGQLIATMDDDFEHPPDQLLKLLEALREHPDWDAVVGCWPIERGLVRDCGSRVHALADRLAWGTPAGFRHTAFRLMRRPVCDALIAHETRLPVVGPMLHRSSNRVFNVEVLHGSRRHGKSGFKFREGVARVLSNFKAGSTAPLQIISWLGTIIAGSSFIFGGFFLFRWMLGARSPSGWLTGVIATTFLGGTILISVGIIGSYLDLIVREVRQTPRWSVRRRTDAKADES